MQKIVGIDLAGKKSSPTGWVLIFNRTIHVKVLYSDKEILKTSIQVKPTIIAIDAPLSLPKLGMIRFVDREMRKRNYPVLPPLYPGMKTLTERGIKLCRQFRRAGIPVIEVHPTSTAKALSIQKERIDDLLKHMKFECLKPIITQHEVDAFLAALTAYLYVRNKCEVIGDKEGAIIIPIKRNWRELKL